MSQSFEAERVVGRGECHVIVGHEQGEPFRVTLATLPGAVALEPDVADAIADEIKLRAASARSRRRAGGPR